MLTKSFLVAVLAVVLMQCAPVAAAREAGWAAALGADLVRLGRIEWALRSAVAPHCPQKAAGAGLVLDSLDAYAPADRAHVRQALGVSLLPTVLAVMPGSPAERAGLRPGDAIMAIGGQLASLLPGGAFAGEAAVDAIESGAPGARVALKVRRANRDFSATLAPQPVCAARAFLKTEDAIGAHSDGVHIAITTGTLRFAVNDDELALVLGHELAHTILHKGRPSGLFSGKAREDEADELGARLAACAGYDIARSLGFWERFAKKDGPGAFRLPTHRGAKARLQRLSDRLPALVCPA